MSKWEMVRLGGVCHILNGYAFDSKFFNTVGEGMPIIRIRDVVRGFTETYITEPYKKELIIHQGDLLIGMDGEFNIAPWNSDDALLNQRVCKITSSSNKLLNKYLYYFLPKELKEIEAVTAFVTVKHLSSKIINSIQIPLPPLEVQRQIADVLDRANVLIEMRKAQIEKLDLLVKSQFIEMFGDPVTNPKGWKMSTVGGEIRFEGGAQPDKRYFEYFPTEENIRLIQIRDYKTDEYITYVPKEKARRFCLVDDVMIGRYGPPIFQILKGLEGAYNVALIKASPIRCHKEYARLFLMQDTLFKYIEGLSQRTAGQTGIDMPKLKTYPFPVPPLALQTQFADFVQQVETQKSLFQQSLSKLEQNYKSLMQKCFREEIFNE